MNKKDMSAFTTGTKGGLKECYLKDKRVYIRRHPDSGQYLVYDTYEKAKAGAPSKLTLTYSQETIKKAYNSGYYHIY